MRDTYKLGLTI